MTARHGWALSEPVGRAPVSLRSRLQLPAADLKELLPGPSGRSAGSTSGGRAIAPRPIWGRFLVREIPRAWELRLPADLRPGDLDVRYEIRTPDGRRDHLGHVSDPSSVMAVRVLSREPVVVGSERGQAVVEGGLALEIRVDSVRSAGSYQGILTVTVNQL